MSYRKNWLSATLLLFVLFPIEGLHARGGSTTSGNGGHVVEGIDQQGHKAYYLWDLVRNGIEKTALVDRNIEVDKSLLRLIKSRINFLSPEEVKLVGQKIREIERFSPIARFILMNHLMTIEWHKVPYDINPVRIFDKLYYPKGSSVINFAMRFDKEVKITRKVWELMNPINRVAGIMHELMFSDFVEGELNLAVPAEKDDDEFEYVDSYRYAEDVALSNDLYNFIAHIFSPALYAATKEAFFEKWNHGSGGIVNSLKDFTSYATRRSDDNNSPIAQVFIELSIYPTPQTDSTPFRVGAEQGALSKMKTEIPQDTPWFCGALRKNRTHFYNFGVFAREVRKNDPEENPFKFIQEDNWYSYNVQSSPGDVASCKRIFWDHIELLRQALEDRQNNWKIYHSNFTESLEEKLSKQEDPFSKG